MVPITRRASSSNKICCIFFNNKPILVHSMLAAGIVQDTFAGEAVEGEGGEEETTLVATSTAISTGILPLRLESLPFLKNLIAKHSRAHAY